MTTIDKEKLAAAIKRYREENDLTLQELANKIPTTLNTVYRWETGVVAPKNQIVIERLKELGIKW
jgi:DNA-binding transcriptional regulator YiaG